jgi:hypothetical protein
MEASISDSTVSAFNLNSIEAFSSIMVISTIAGLISCVCRGGLKRRIKKNKYLII